jgi:hypothetical protein
MGTNITLQDEYPSPTVKVTIGQTQIEEILTKKYKYFTPPTVTNERDITNGAKNTLTLDLLQIERRLSVDGVIAVSVGTVSPERATALQKKQDLKKLIEKGGIVYMTYEGYTFTGNFEQVSIIDKSDDSATKDNYDVKFTFLKTDDLA